MSSFQIIGTGCCGFLRFYQMLKQHVPIKFKGGGPKYQNSFEKWNSNSGLVWDMDDLPKEERIRRVKLNNVGNDIGHYYLRYVEDLISIEPDIKIVCLKGQRQHSIKSLTTSWGFRNPCFSKNREIGIGKNRYAVEQFPNLSECDSPYTATEKYWDLYYTIAEKLKYRFSSNFLIVDSVRFFENEEYQKDCLKFLKISIPFFCSPLDMKKNVNSVTLHGGLGNNLFQMAEALVFCEINNFEKPVFGTWDLWNGGGKYPQSYNSDKFLGGHEGSHEQFVDTFKNLNWKGNLTCDYDTKFIINDMFSFSDLKNYRQIILKNYDFSKSMIDKINKKYSKLFNNQTTSIHLRTCSLTADDHINGSIPDQFFINCVNEFSNDTLFLVFSDNLSVAEQKIKSFVKETNKNFILIDEDVFTTLAMISMCDNHILHVSTFSFWGAYLNKKLEKAKVFYHKNWEKAHGKNMIPFNNWMMRDEK